MHNTLQGGWLEGRRTLMPCHPKHIWLLTAWRLVGCSLSTEQRDCTSHCVCAPALWHWTLLQMARCFLVKPIWHPHARMLRSAAALLCPAPAPGCAPTAGAGAVLPFWCLTHVEGSLQCSIALAVCSRAQLVALLQAQLFSILCFRLCLLVQVVRPSTAPCWPQLAPVWSAGQVSAHCVPATDGRCCWSCTHASS